METISVFLRDSKVEVSMVFVSKVATWLLMEITWTAEVSAVVIDVWEIYC